MKMKITAKQAYEKAVARQEIVQLEEVIKNVAENGGVRIEFGMIGNNIISMDSGLPEDFVMTHEIYQILIENGYEIEMNIDCIEAQKVCGGISQSPRKINYIIDWSKGNKIN